MVKLDLIHDEVRIGPRGRHAVAVADELADARPKGRTSGPRARAGRPPFVSVDGRVFARTGLDLRSLA
jgi:hypothetical protein